MLKRCEAVKFFQDAKQEIEKGWCQGTLEDQRGRVCALGARSRIVKRKWGRFESLPLEKRNDFAEEAEYTLKILCDALPMGGMSIPIYNDTPGRTKQEILDLFDRASEIACKTLED